VQCICGIYHDYHICTTTQPLETGSFVVHAYTLWWAHSRHIGYAGTMAKRHAQMSYLGYCNKLIVEVLSFTHMYLHQCFLCCSKTACHVAHTCCTALCELHMRSLNQRSALTLETISGCCAPCAASAWGLGEIHRTCGCWGCPARFQRVTTGTPAAPAVRHNRIAGSDFVFELLFIRIIMHSSCTAANCITAAVCVLASRHWCRCYLIIQ
jgi:hypothetical protein